MRRKDREVLDPEHIDDIINSCDCCRLGFSDGKEAYIVPMNFGFTHENGERVFYFHSAKEGRKLDLIRKNGCAGFELDTNHRLETGASACECSFKFQSVIGFGKIEILEEYGEKEKALGYIMRQYTGKSNWSFEEKQLNITAVIKLTVQTIACKEIS